jgi:DNA polymerase elongation subunit (family B)
MQDLEKEIKKLSLKQGAIKILINSIYGAFGNKWFYFYDPDIAQSITLQGQDLIKFSIKAVNFYFKEKWHLDTELHKILGIEGCRINKITQDSAIYTDTDSIYVQFNSAIESIQGIEIDNEEAIRMCIKIDEHRLAGYFEQCFKKYSKMFNTDNRQTFKLENLSDKGFWIKKKNYAIRIVYEPNPKSEPFPIDERYMIIKGLEPIKSSYPVWARKHQMKFIEYLLEEGRRINLETDLIPKIKEVHREFMTLPVDEIAMNFSVRVYDKYVASEEKCLLKKGATPYPKAVMHHNHLILKSDLEGKYPKIREGSKVKFYYCTPNNLELEVFAYNPGDYPKEIAPEIDLKQQFFILIVEPVNRVLTAIGLNNMDIDLKRAVEFKTSKSKNPLTREQLFPLWVIDSQTLEHEQVDEMFWDLIGNNTSDIPEDIFDQYLATITRYGLNTVVLINKNLKPYINRISKKLAIANE